ncbi:heterocycloanthracin/sonorensin family bacteriocin [Fictibacillus enclensis]|uniref:heterocycloanthracin/sonorensin family bacteriocin n=1 Tax=Fictibacillus enclensis TaxID=1017270 RepID=UPI0025A1D543|nr:heterocycloanthracin/sonorensin family bacteriocin [Fictibacillus enclensis]MDM5197291.1 heterocycloanthracin/sonorensin family bacteriocin [Fictibacillus enclensis]
MDEFKWNLEGLNTEDVSVSNVQPNYPQYQDMNDPARQCVVVGVCVVGTCVGPCGGCGGCGGCVGCVGCVGCARCAGCGGCARCGGCGGRCGGCGGCGGRCGGHR